MKIRYNEDAEVVARLREALLSFFYFIRVFFMRSANTAFCRHLLCNSYNAARKCRCRVNHDNRLASNAECIRFIQNQRQLRAAEDEAVAVVGLDQILCCAQ